MGLTLHRHKPQMQQFQVLWSPQRASWSIASFAGDFRFTLQGRSLKDVQRLEAFTRLSAAMVECWMCQVNLYQGKAKW